MSRTGGGVAVEGSSDSCPGGELRPGAGVSFWRVSDGDVVARGRSSGDDRAQAFSVGAIGDGVPLDLVPRAKARRRPRPNFPCSGRFALAARRDPFPRAADRSMRCALLGRDAVAVVGDLDADDHIGLAPVQDDCDVVRIGVEACSDEFDHGLVGSFSWARGPGRDRRRRRVVGLHSIILSGKSDKRRQVRHTVGFGRWTPGGASAGQFEQGTAEML